MVNIYICYISLYIVYHLNLHLFSLQSKEFGVSV